MRIRLKERELDEHKELEEISTIIVDNFEPKNDYSYLQGFIPASSDLLFFVVPKVYGAYCIIRYKDKRLIIKNSYKDYWTIPCGMVDPGESYLAAAVGETREEVGIDLNMTMLNFLSLIQSFDEFKEDNIYLYSVRLDREPLK